MRSPSRPILSSLGHECFSLHLVSSGSQQAAAYMQLDHRSNVDSSHSLPDSSDAGSVREHAGCVMHTRAGLKQALSAGIAF